MMERRYPGDTRPNKTLSVGEAIGGAINKIGAAVNPYPASGPRPEHPDTKRWEEKGGTLTPPPAAPAQDPNSVIGQIRQANVSEARPDMSDWSLQQNANAADAQLREAERRQPIAELLAPDFAKTPAQKAFEQQKMDKAWTAQQAKLTQMKMDAGLLPPEEAGPVADPVVGQVIRGMGATYNGQPSNVYVYDNPNAKPGEAVRTYSDAGGKREGRHTLRDMKGSLTINPTGKLVDPQTGNPFITNDPAALADFEKRVGSLQGAAKEWHDYETARQGQVVDAANQNAALQPARDQLRKTMNTPGDQRLDYDKVINQLYPPQQAPAPSWGDAKRAEFQAKEKADQQQLQQFNLEMAKEKMLEQFKSKITGGDKPELNWTAYQDMLNEEDPTKKAHYQSLLRQLGLLPEPPQDSQ